MFTAQLEAVGVEIVPVRYR